MSELTKEHFDEVVQHLASKDQIEELARMVNHGFEDVLERIDVRDQVQRHQKALEEISKKMDLHFEL